MKPVQVVVIDDSPTMRRLIALKLERDPAIKVVGSASDPFEAREAIKTLNPDVVTLDVEMPGMNGIEFLEKIMRLRPMPVVMVSSLTQPGAATTLQALELGAVDCVGKPDLEDLNEKVKAAATAKVSARSVAVRRAISQKSGSFGDQVIVIGSSTGGVEALINVIGTFPENCPPTLIAQHMPRTFTTSFAARLDRVGHVSVSEATDGAVLKPGQVYLAPGGTHLEVAGQHSAVCRLVEAPPVNGHCPSIDVLFRSAARRLGSRVVGAILTGMGRDGAEGLLAIRRAGGRTIAQDAASSIVYGMPRVAFEIGAAERQVPLNDVGPTLLQLCAASVRDRV